VLLKSIKGPTQSPLGFWASSSLELLSFSYCFMSEIFGSKPAPIELKYFKVLPYYSKLGLAI